VYEIEVIQGLEFITQQELKTFLPSKAITYQTKGIIQVDTTQEDDLLKLRTAIAVYKLFSFPIPRPKALLGHQYLTSILSAITQITKKNTFSSFSIGVAGDDTSVIQRIRNEISQHTKLEFQPEKGDLHIRIRKSLTLEGWDVLIRLTPRPLATRTWRKHNMQGALSAPVAHAMIKLFNQSHHTLLNVGCGSGTLLIEAINSKLFQLGIGIDNDLAMLNLTNEHIKEAKVRSLISCCDADMRKLPFENASFSAVCSDFPFGQLVGTKEYIEQSYGYWLYEIARITKPQGTCIIITHAIKLMEKELAQLSKLWHIKSVYPIVLNGLHPKIYLLERC
jgi:tRNA (guanine6-N2)-methyltransferase